MCARKLAGAGVRAKAATACVDRCGVRAAVHDTSSKGVNCGVRVAEPRARVQECAHCQSGTEGRVHVLCAVQWWSVLDGICGVADGRGVGLDVLVTMTQMAI
jgi:hypothetical protein